MNLTPREIVAELDKHIIGQNDAKKQLRLHCVIGSSKRLPSH